MWLSMLLYPDTAVDAGQDKALAVPTDLTFVLSWQSNLCRHGYFTSHIHVLLRHRGVFVKVAFCQAEKRSNTLPRYASNVFVHCHTLHQAVTNQT